MWPRSKYVWELMFYIILLTCIHVNQNHTSYVSWLMFPNPAIFKLPKYLTKAPFVQNQFIYYHYTNWSKPIYFPRFSFHSSTEPHLFHFRYQTSEKFKRQISCSYQAWGPFSDFWLQIELAYMDIPIVVCGPFHWCQTLHYLKHLS